MSPKSESFAHKLVGFPEPEKQKGGEEGAGSAQKAQIIELRTGLPKFTPLQFDDSGLTPPGKISKEQERARIEADDKAFAEEREKMKSRLAVHAAMSKFGFLTKLGKRDDEAGASMVVGDALFQSNEVKARRDIINQEIKRLQDELLRLKFVEAKYDLETLEAAIVVLSKGDRLSPRNRSAIAESFSLDLNFGLEDLVPIYTGIKEDFSKLGLLSLKE